MKIQTTIKDISDGKYIPEERKQLGGWSNISKRSRSGNQEDLPAENDGDVSDETVRKKEVPGTKVSVKKTIHDI